MTFTSSTFRMLFEYFLDMGEIVLGFMNTSIGDLTRSLLLGVVAQIFPSLEEITVFEAMFSFGLPIVLAYTLVIWILNSVT